MEEEEMEMEAAVSAEAAVESVGVEEEEMETKVAVATDAMLV